MTVIAPLLCIIRVPQCVMLPRGAVVKNPPSNARNAGDVGSVPGSGRSPGGWHSNPLQYSLLENPMDRRAWWITVHGVVKSDTTEVT